MDTHFIGVFSCHGSYPGLAINPLSSFWFDTIILGKSIVHILGCPVIIFKKYCILSEDLFFTIRDPDEMQHHSLQMYLFGVFPNAKGYG